jgi:hypothetical protein
MKRAFAACREQARLKQAIQVMTQRGRWHVDPRLDVASARPIPPALHNNPQDRKAYGMAQRAELGGMTLELRAHPLLLICSK